MQPLEAKVAALEKQLEKKTTDENMNPIFFAKKEKNLPAHHAPLNPKLKVGLSLGNMYDEVVVNIGNGLDIKSGEFKAPFTGYYYFHASSVSQPGKKAELRHNKKAVVSKTVPSGKHSLDTWFPNELQATLLLNAGDKVSVHFEATEGKWNSVNNHGVTFTGFLLRRTFQLHPTGAIIPIIPIIDDVTTSVVPPKPGPGPVIHPKPITRPRPGLVNRPKPFIHDVPEPIAPIVPEPVDPIKPEPIDPIKPEPLPITIEPVDLPIVPVIAVLEETNPEPNAPAPPVEEKA